MIDGIISISLLDNSDGSTGFATDKIDVVIYDELDDVLTINKAVGTRSSSTVSSSINLRNVSATRDLHVWVFATDDNTALDNFKTSDNTYNSISIFA